MSHFLKKVAQGGLSKRISVWIVILAFAEKIRMKNVISYTFTSIFAENPQKTHLNCKITHFMYEKTPCVGRTRGLPDYEDWIVNTVIRGNG